MSEDFPPPPHAIVLFDGVCGLCNRMVDSILRRDRRGRFRFASLQSAAGKRLLTRHGLDSEGIDTVVLIEGERAWTKSTAALRILKLLGFPASAAYLAIAVPRPLRDWAYDWVAKTRYRLFGKHAACRVPSAAEGKRFLE